MRFASSASEQVSYVDAVEPVELRVIEDGTGGVHALQLEAFHEVRQREHLFVGAGRPAAERQVVDHRLG